MTPRKVKRHGKQVSLTIPEDMVDPVMELAASRRLTRNALVVSLLARELAAEARKAAKAATAP